MRSVAAAEMLVKRLGWLCGLEVMAYRRSVPARRAMLLNHLGVDLMVDVGANTGQYARQLRWTGYRGAILSVEPLAAPFRSLSAASARDAAWTSVRAAAGDRTGELVMHVSQDSVYSSALPITPRPVAANRSAAFCADETVTVRRLDDIVAGTAYRRLGLKVDVQGFEREVLAGAPRSLADAVFLEVELSPAPVYEGQMLIAEAWQRLTELGFRLALTENVFEDFATGEAIQLNGVFVRDQPANLNTA